MDMAVFDFLMGNMDRHHYETLKVTLQISYNGIKIWFLYKPSLRYNHISSVVAFWRKDVPTAFGPWSWFWEVKSQRAYNFSAYLSMLHDEILNVSDAHQISHKSSKPWGCFIWQLKTRCLKQDKSYSTGPTFQSHWQKGRNYTTGMYLGLIDVNNLIFAFCKFMISEISWNSCYNICK